MSTRSIALALAAAATFAAPAAAAETKETVTKGVQYKDLDLTTEAGQKALASRLDSAAREVCGIGETTVGSRISTRESRDCYRDAREQLGKQLSRVTKGAYAG